MNKIKLSSTNLKMSLLYIFLKTCFQVLINCFKSVFINSPISIGRQYRFTDIYFLYAIIPTCKYILLICPCLDLLREESIIEFWRKYNKYMILITFTIADINSYPVNYYQKIKQIIHKKIRYQVPINSYICYVCIHLQLSLQ